MNYRIEPVENSLLNLKGWRIVRADGAVLLPFTTKREAEKLIDFFAPTAYPTQGDYNFAKD